MATKPTAEASTQTVFRGPTAEEVLDSLESFIIKARKEFRLRDSQTMAKAIHALENGPGKKAIERAAKESRSVYSQFEEFSSPMRTGESAYQNRMAPLLATLLLLITEEEGREGKGY